MTVAAWDGTTLAADRRAENGGVIRTTTKIRKANGCLFAMCGDTALGAVMIDWLVAGADPDKLPRVPDEVTATVMQIDATGAIAMYVSEALPYPVHLDDARHAIGSGREFALMAMKLGANARDAVEATFEFDIFSGNGVDTFTLEDNTLGVAA